jgi:hypothetical protein
MRSGLAEGVLVCAASLALTTASHAASQRLRAPTLEGQWHVNFIVPFEATPQTPNLVVPEAEAKIVAAAFRKDWGELFATMFLDPEAPDALRNSDGLPIVRGQRRTRALVLPADGMLPYTAAGRQEAAAMPAGPTTDNPEDRPGPERCTSSGAPPLVFFTFFDAEMMILRTRDQVVLFTEYDHDARIVPITDLHLPRVLHSRGGDSIGHWEGKTLVIETVGQSEQDRVRFWPQMIVPGEAKVIERLTPISDRELLYQFTVVEPKTYAAPWLGEFSWFRTAKPMYENACHEGNYALPNVLAGARYEEAHATAPPSAPR